MAMNLVEALEAQNLRCWIAPRDVVPGSVYADGILRAINGAQMLALLLSKHAIGSGHVSKEVERASSKRLPIVVLRVDAAPLSPAFEYHLSESQWIDLAAGGVAEAGAKLVDAVRSHRETVAERGTRPGDSAVLRFGAFALDPADRRLYADGRPVAIGHRAFNVLVLLAENPGRLVTKTMLLERVWQGSRADGSKLAAQIAGLRRILGTDMIHTVPGFGYRLEFGPHSAAPAPAPKRDRPSAPTVAVRHEPPSVQAPQPIWPDRLAPLVGRDDDLRGIQAALAEGCLVTVVGGAGVGKTRLAREVFARATEAGQVVAWVALEPLETAQNVPPAIALALGLSLPENSAGFVALGQALVQERVLLILDGAEHLIEQLAAPLTMLVSQTRQLAVLVTSQAPLGVPGETIYRLPALSVPNDGVSATEAAAYPALALFAQRVSAADRRFALNAANTSLVAAICRRLDGNPLALELAAARVPALGVAALLQHLDDRFRLLNVGARGANPRHGALRTAFEWSYGLLDAAERRAFNRLGAFPGSFNLNIAARSIADDPAELAEAVNLIGRLVDRSLVATLPTDPPRYVLLESARYFALDKLQAAGELDAAKSRMAAATLHELDEAYNEYWSLDEAIWLLTYAAEIDNVRTAIDWAADHDYATFVALYGSAWPLYSEMELFSEVRARLPQVTDTALETLPRARAGRLWEAVATYESNRQCAHARHAAESAAAIHRDTGDSRACYYALLLLALNRGADESDARDPFVEARRLENASWPARLLTHGALTEGALLIGAGDFAGARSAYRDAVRLALAVSERQALAATIHIVELDVLCGDTDAGLHLGRPLSLSLARSGSRATRFEVMTVIFTALLLKGEIAEARATGIELYELAMQLDPGILYSVVDAMAYLACTERRFDAAAQISCAADRFHRAHGQGRRRPMEERMHVAVLALLDEHLAPGWQALQSGRTIDEAGACALALGLTA